MDKTNRLTIKIPEYKEESLDNELELPPKKYFLVEWMDEENESLETETYEPTFRGLFRNINRLYEKVGKWIENWRDRRYEEELEIIQGHPYIEIPSEIETTREDLYRFFKTERKSYDRYIFYKCLYGSSNSKGLLVKIYELPLKE